MTTLNVTINHFDWLYSKMDKCNKKVADLIKNWFINIFSTYFDEFIKKYLEIFTLINHLKKWLHLLKKPTILIKKIDWKCHLIKNVLSLESKAAIIGVQSCHPCILNRRQLESYALIAHCCQKSENFCLEFPTLSENWSVFGCLKSKLVRISDTLV